jgi:membrane-bound metal-dependent hydrolase YbcI (DUF457 family)
MFIGHLAVGLAGKRAAPSVSLATWLTAVQLVDMVWPIFLLAGLEHVRIAPGITPFTPLDFYDYPLTHSLIGSLFWAAIFAGGWYAARRDARIALLLAAGVLSHWLLDVVSHRPDMPVLLDGPYLGLGLWYSIAATLAVEIAMFAAAVVSYVRGGFPGARRVSFWLMIGVVCVAYFGAAFGPPPPDVRTLAITGLAGWLFVPWAWWADRARGSGGRA